jgi:hypothetical protein
MVMSTWACGSIGRIVVLFADERTVKSMAADLVGSAALVAVTVTLGGDGTTAGAVYIPLPLIVPQAAPLHPDPATRHATDMFGAPVTDASNCCAIPVGTEAPVGLTATKTSGTTVTVAKADMVGSAMLVAITWTLVGAGPTEGGE